MNITQYLKGVKNEGKRISWPSTRVAWMLTALVIVVSLLIAAYLGLLDFIFTWIVENIFVM